MQESHRNDAVESAGSSFTWLDLVGRLFGGTSVNETVKTPVRFDGSPAMVWSEIAFYEEIPGRAPFPLRLFMPIPVRAEGAKAKVGAQVRCVYTSGALIKRMTVFDPPHLLRFEVLEQHVGIEGCAVAERGSYEIQACGDSCHVILTTHYRSYLHPRWLWRPIETVVTHQLHRHILNGMRGALGATSEGLPAPTRSV